MDDVIVLSDFRKDGWQMSKSMVNLSLDHILAAGKSISIENINQKFVSLDWFHVMSNSNVN